MEVQKHITPTLEEQANIVTHGIGFIISLFGMAYLLNLGLENNASQLELLSLSIFSFSMVLVYFTSTIYHYSTNPDIRFRLRVLDHISIYFLIAGTHTPFLFYYLNNPTGQFFLILLWGLVALGILYKLFLFGRYQLLSVIFYLFMGWMAIFTMPPMLDQLAPGVLFWVILAVYSTRWG